MTVGRVSPSRKKASAPRPYNAPRRRAQAEETHASILTAARTLLIERGWSGTTTREIARTAGVAEPTVYATFGNKAGLAGALIADVAAHADNERQAAGLAAGRGDPAAQLAAMIGFDRRLYEYGAEVLIALRDAGLADPTTIDAYRAGRAEGDRLRERVFRRWPRGTLRVTRSEAIDVYAAICNVDVFRTLTTERRWTPERTGRWMHRTLCELLLA